MSNQESLKSLIKPSMLVKLNNGALCVVMDSKEGIVLVEEEERYGRYVYYLQHYNENLEYGNGLAHEDREYDIVTIYGLSDAYDTLDFSKRGRKVVWERKKRKMTLKEIEERLGMKIEII